MPIIPFFKYFNIPFGIIYWKAETLWGEIKAWPFEPGFFTK
jgi:hypothetical protein